MFTINRLGHLGDGVADGPLFAPRTLPGETVTGVVDGEQLTNVKIVTPSDARVKPACSHYNGCGGCQVMHATDDFVADWKRQNVIAALAMQGITADVGAVETSPPASRRRATLSVRRTKKGTLTGFHGRASDVIVAVPNCKVLTPNLIAGFPAVDALGAILCSRKGEVAITVTDTETGLDITCQGGKPMDVPTEGQLAEVVGHFNIARLVVDGELIAQADPPILRFGMAQVSPPPGAFCQATAHGEATLLAAVRDIVGKADQIVDLFAGCGTFALPLAEHAEVHAVEGDAAMTAALDAGWRGAKGLKQVTTETRDLFRRPLYPDELKRFDAVVIDPPRAGAADQVAQLCDARRPVIAHVSCNPATFARDAAALIAAGYQMGPVQVIDQFRWSTHIEVVAGFTLA